MMHELMGKCKKILVKKMMKMSEMEEKKKKELPPVQWVKLKDEYRCKKKRYKFFLNK